MYELWYFFNKELKDKCPLCKKPMSNKKSNKLTFEDIIFNLQNFCKKVVLFCSLDIELEPEPFILLHY